MQDDELPILVSSHAAVEADKSRGHPFVSSRMEAHTPVGALVHGHTLAHKMTYHAWNHFLQLPSHLIQSQSST